MTDRPAGEARGDAIDRWIGQRWRLLLAAGAVSSVATFSGYAHAKVPWMDEVLLLAIARLKSVAEIRRALMDGIQTDPPILQTLTHYLFQNFGEHVFLARLPAILGFTLMCVCLAILVSRHAPPIYAAAAFFLPYATTLRVWSMDARPYGMMLGFSALAMLCWDALGGAGSRHEARWRVGLALSLAATFSTHFYSILLLGPIGAGELTRWVLRKRIDWRTVACIAVALIPYAAWLPILISGMRVFHVSSQYHGRVSFDNLANFYSWAAPSLPLAGLFFLLVAFALGGAKLHRKPGVEEEISEGYRALLAAVLGFLALPVIGYVAGLTVTGFFINYYHMISIFGIILGLPLLLAYLSAGNRAIGLCLLAAIGAQGAMVTVRGVSGFKRRDAGYPTLAAMRKLIPEPKPDIVVAAPALFLPMHEANRFDPERNLVFLFDPKKEMAEMGTSTADILYRQLRPYTDARIEAWDSYVAAHPAFYLAVSSQPTIEAWQYSYLVKRAHASLRWLGQTGGFDIYQVQLGRGES